MMRMKSRTRFPVGKLTILLATVCLLLLLAGCGGHGKSAASAPVPTTASNQAPTTQTAGTAAPLATSSQQPDNQTATDNQGIVFTHSYSPGHSYRITLPGYWRGKYSVKETNDQLGEGWVTFSYYKPVYYTARPGSDQKVAGGDDPIFGICAEAKSQWEKEKQGPGGYGIELASRDGLIFVLWPSIVNDYQGSDKAQYGEMADDAWLKIGKTFTFVDGN